jgi:uncharacterized membrane protein YedE/YeeE
MNLLVSALAGLAFGIGLAISGMVNPATVQAFLDLSGQWQPTLGFVMGGALLVNIPLYWYTRRRRTRPLLEPRFVLPTATQIDRRLIVGAACFGIGWGIAGFCPGPALASLSTGLPLVLEFCLAMFVGMFIAQRVGKH